MRMLLCIFAMLVSSSVWAAFMKNVPQTLTQPNGSVVQAFASGDEYYNWIHDADGYTILKNAKSGVYVYAAKSSGKLITTAYVVGQSNPSLSGLKPNLLDDAAVINAAVKAKQASHNTQKSNSRNAKPSNLSVRPAVGAYNNVVVYIQFSDQTSTTLTRAACESIFNGTGVVSVKDFFNEVSNGQLNVNSTFYPNATNTYPVFYTDSHPRSYYLKDTPDGYGTGSTVDREHTLLKNAIDAIASQVPASLVIDGNNDGFVDNVTFVINGQPAGWADLLWPHRWSLFSQNAYINSKQVYDYNTCFSEAIGAGVISHEMFHSFSAPDLYSYDSWTPITAVGDWDLMASGDWTTPRHMTVYLKSRYGTWTTIPEITATGNYTLQSVATSPFSAFKIKLPNSTNEYLVVEYRKKAGRYESALSGDDGMLIYRVNENGSNASGPNQEVYIYRPNGTNTVNGDLQNATLNNTLGRTSFNDATNPSDFLSTNQLGGLLANAGISNVVLNGNSLTFKFTGNSVATCIEQAWDAATPYVGGSKVSYNNIVYTAGWWTKGDQPDMNTGSGKPWTQTGTCGGAVNKAPVAAFTAPAKNSTFNTGTNVTLKADAADPDGTISKVEFVNAADVVIFSDNTAPYEYTLSGLAKGAYVYRVKAYDNQNLASDYAYNNFDIVDPVSAPSVTITSPTEGQVLKLAAGGKINVTVSTSPAVVDSVKFIIVDVVCNGPGCANVRRYVAKTAPYAISYDPIDGAVSSQVNAVAFKNGIGSNSAVVNYTVKKVVPPVITITSPLPGAGMSTATYVVGGSITVSANVTDADGTISKVEFTQGSTATGMVTKTSAPYTAVFTGLPEGYPDGSYYFTVKAYDNDGNVTTQLVTVYKNRKPTIFISSPSQNANFAAGTIVTVTSTINDPDFTSGKVEYFNGVTKLGETVINSTIANPNISYNLTGLAAGTYALTAKITDDMLQSSVSTVVNFTVTTTAGCTDQVWNSATPYTINTIVSRLGKRYKAAYWSSGAAPETHSGAYQEWILLGSCGARVAEVSAANALLVYPNPFTADATVSIDLANADEVSVDVYNTFGEKAALVFAGRLEAGKHNFTLNTQALASGIYIVRVSGAGISEKVTVIKN